MLHNTTDQDIKCEQCLRSVSLKIEKAPQIVIICA